jgi:hypothetical protein
MPSVDLHAPRGCVPGVACGHRSNAAPKPYCKAKAAGAPALHCLDYFSLCLVMMR